MSNSEALVRARLAKKDEFYTNEDDVIAEMRFHEDRFRGKIVLCNCDDPSWSAFWRYFHSRFSSLGLKKLISTHFEKGGQPSYALIYEGGDDSDFTVGKRIALSGNGDFRSEECIVFLEEADIVVTNPPFSLFREYIAQLIEYDKKFIVLGNINAITCKDIFPFVSSDRLWFGPSISSGDRKFYVPDDYPLEAAGCGVDDDGRRFVKVKGVRWFTNLDHAKRHEPLRLTCRYKSGEYSEYDDYDAINVGFVKDIPCDYDGVMGVPITFLDKYDPDQFQIVAFLEDGSVREASRVDPDDCRTSIPGMIKNSEGRIDGRPTYARITIRKRSSSCGGD